MSKYKKYLHALIILGIVAIYVAHFLGLSLNYFGIFTLFCVSLFYIRTSLSSNLVRANRLANIATFLSLLLILERSRHPNIIDGVISPHISLIAILIARMIFTWQIYDGKWKEKLVYNVIVSGVLYLVSMIVFASLLFISYLMVPLPQEMSIRYVTQENLFTYVIDGCIDYGGSASTFGGRHSFKVRYTNFILWERLEDLSPTGGCA